MLFNVRFSESNQSFNPRFGESTLSFNPQMGETHLIHGKDGGYYTPVVSQIDENTMRVSFIASNDGMEPIADMSIRLPAGKGGEDGYTPQKGVDYYTSEDQQILLGDLYEMLKGGVEVATAKIGEVTLLASGWVGGDNLYSQVVNIDGVTERSQVDLTPDVQQLAVFYNKDLSFVTENDGGVVTVYAIGQKPTNDYTIQVTITEVDV